MHRLLSPLAWGGMDAALRVCCWCFLSTVGASPTPQPGTSSGSYVVRESSNDSQNNLKTPGKVVRHSALEYQLSFATHIFQITSIEGRSRTSAACVVKGDLLRIKKNLLDCSRDLLAAFQPRSSLHARKKALIWLLLPSEQRTSSSCRTTPRFYSTLQRSLYHTLISASQPWSRASKALRPVPRITRLS